jgi:hypothetical protein
MSSTELNAFLNWDTFIAMCFIIIVLYSFIIGKAQTIKLISSAYIAILASDALGFLLSEGTLFFRGIGGAETVMMIKITAFVLITVILTIRGAFDVVVGEEKMPIIRLIMTGAFGIMSAGVIVSTIMLFVSGNSLLLADQIIAPDPVEAVSSNLRLVPLMMNNYWVWFGLPAAALVTTSLFGNDD